MSVAQIKKGCGDAFLNGVKDGDVEGDHHQETNGPHPSFGKDGEVGRTLGDESAAPTIPCLSAQLSWQLSNAAEHLAQTPKFKSPANSEG
jgi:hypothetical protein